MPSFPPSLPPSSLPGDTRESPKSRVYYPEMTSNQFMELIQLCPDHAMLGTYLLTMAKSVSAAENNTAQSKHQDYMCRDLNTTPLR